MRSRWFTCLGLMAITVLLVGPAVAQTPGSGSGSAPAPGTLDPTNPQPAPSPAQSGSPSGGMMPGTPIPKSVPPSTGQMGSGSQSPSAAGPAGTNGSADATQVRTLQKALQDKGMNPGPIDGINGPKTEAAIRAYQKAQKLPETGRLDPQTRERLGASR